MTGLKVARVIPCVAATCVALALGALGSSALAQPAAGQMAIRDYRIANGDSLQIVVYRNPDLTVSVPVRPDGKISIPLVEDIACVGKTPSELARLIETRLNKYITNPNVTVIVNSFSGSYDQEVRIVGEAVTPKAILYKNNMSVLDAMIDVGGLTRFAAGNSATLVRNVNGSQIITKLKLRDLLQDGDIKANVGLMPGDIIIIPQSYF